MLPDGGCRTLNLMIGFTGQLEVDGPPAAVFELLADMTELHSDADSGALTGELADMMARSLRTQ